MRVFISHLLNENDINTFEIIETQHFDTSNFKYITNRRNPSHKSNKRNITISTKKWKLCNQNFVHQFHSRSLISPNAEK